MITFFIILLYTFYPRNTGSPKTVYLAFAFGFVAIVFLSFGVKKLWSRYLKLRIFKTFLFPGTIVHELSHTLICLVTGTTIKELNIFKLESSGIQYDKPKVPILFDFLIATAPIFGCAFAIVLLSIVLENPIHVNESLPKEVTFSVKAIFDYAKDFLDIIWLTLNEFWERGFRTAGSAIFIIASIIFTVCMAPHKGDIKYVVLGFIILGGILFGLELCGISLLGIKWWEKILDTSWSLMSYIISILLTILFVSAIIVGLIKGVKLIFGSKSGKDDD